MTQGPRRRGSAPTSCGGSEAGDDLVAVSASDGNRRRRRYLSRSTDDAVAAQRLVYCSSLTGLSHVTTSPASSASCTATYAMKRSGVAPCQ